MEVTEEAILEKVRRLFELSKSSNIHEAEAAMMKAQELLHKYNLDAGAVPTDEKQPFVREFITLKNKSRWSESLMNVIGKYNGVRVIHTAEQLALIGQRHAIEITIFGYQQMEKKITWLAELAWDIEEDKYLFKPGKYMDEYSLGAVYALRGKLEANKMQFEARDSKESMALVKVYDAELERAVTGFYPRLFNRRGPSVGGDAYARGQRAGGYLEVNAGITSGGAGRRMLNG